MITKTVDISKKYNASIVKKLDKSNYFQLSKDATGRKELFNFAVALGINQGYHSSPDSRESFYRTESIGNSLYLYSALYFQENVASEPSSIDEMLNYDDIIKLAEDYANTGFSVLEEHEKATTPDLLMYTLLSEIDKKYETFKQEMLKEE